MQRQGADTTRLWIGIIALAMVVIALFFVDPFTASPESTDPLNGADDVPVVAYFPRDAERSENRSRTEPADEVLGTVVESESGIESRAVARTPGLAGS